MEVKLGHLVANVDDNNRPVVECLAELEREINLRISKYPDWIESRKLSSIDAKDRLERLGKAYHLLEDHYIKAQSVPTSQSNNDAKPF